MKANKIYNRVDIIGKIWYSKREEFITELLQIKKVRMHQEEKDPMAKQRPLRSIMNLLKKIFMQDNKDNHDIDESTNMLKQYLEKTSIRQIYSVNQNMDDVMMDKIFFRSDFSVELLKKILEIDPKAEKICVQYFPSDKEEKVAEILLSLDPKSRKVILDEEGIMGIVLSRDYKKSHQVNMYVVE